MQTRRWNWFIVTLLTCLMLLLMMTTVAWAAGEGSPLLQEEENTTDALWIALAPLLAIATFVERVLEVVWERWEQANVWPNMAGVENTSDATYITQKKLRSHWLGTAIALVAVGLTNVRFFRLLGFDVLFSSPGWVLFDAQIGGIFDNFTVGTLIDWMMTAGIVGWGGTELTHSIIEGLVKGRSLWKEMRSVEAGRQSILDAKFFNEYVAPELEKRGVSVASLRQTAETLKGLGVSVDDLFTSMTTGRVDHLLAQMEADPQKAEAAQALRAFLDGVPPEKQAEIPNILILLTPEQRRRFLGM